MSRKQLDPKQKPVAWLQHMYAGEFSELGKTVAYFLDEMWGLHHLSNTSLKKMDWSDDNSINIIYGNSMSTVDHNDLTRLVVIAHQMMLRVSLRGVGPGYVELMFHQRTNRNREDGFANHCPEIYEHVSEICIWHPSVEQLAVRKEIEESREAREGKDEPRISGEGF